MANPDHLATLKEGVVPWQRWRKQYPGVRPDFSQAKLSSANLVRANLSEADLRWADLKGAKLEDANLYEADLLLADLEEADLNGANFGRANLNGAKLIGARLIGANLTGSNLEHADFSGANLKGAGLKGSNISVTTFENANLHMADLSETCLSHVSFGKADLSEANLSGSTLTYAFLDEANLSQANLSKARMSHARLHGADLRRARIRAAQLIQADLSEADLRWAELSGAHLNEADLRHVTLVNANLEDANLTACRVYGISAWNVRLQGAIQKNLVITPDDESPIQVDNLEVAQFIYLLLNNEKIRHVIDTITSKLVLILGRFTSERKVVLDMIREELRKRDYLPVLFDFAKPSSRTTVETISTLAHMARFVIADLTDAKSVLQELQTLVPVSPSVVVQPLLLASQQEPGMFDFIRKFPWVLDTLCYADQSTLLLQLTEKVIDPAEAKVKEIASRIDST